MASIKQEVRKFGETVSVRGVPRILKTDDRILCTAWLVCVLASTAILVWQLTILFIKYYQWPVTTTYGEQWKEAPTFPDVTMCNLYPLSRELDHDLTWNDYINIIKEEKAFYPYNESLLETWKINDSFADFSQDVYELIWDYYIQQPSGYFRNLPVTDDTGISATCPSFVIDCSFVDTNWQQSTSLNCMEFVTSFWNSEYFQCYTIHLNDSFKQTIRGLTTVLYIDDFPQDHSLFSADLTSPSGRGVRVAVHSPGTKPDLKRGISVGPGTETTVKIAQTIRQRLSKPYSGSDCSSMKYLLGSHTELYTYDACFDTCVQQQIVDACKCVSEFYMYTEEQLRQGNNKLCGNQSLLANASNYMDPQGLIDLWCSLSAYDSSDTDKCDNQCFFPCYENIYDTAVSSSPWPHLSYHLNFYQRYIGGCIDSYSNKFDEYNTLWTEFYPGGLDIADQATKKNVTQKLRQLSLIEDNFLQINFVIDNNKPYSLVDKPFYSIEQMISLVGGCLSLWLGITVMTAVELVEFMYSLLLACKQKCGRKDENDEGDPKPTTANAGIPMQTDPDALK